MKRKIVGIFVCMLMIATAIPAVESLKNSAINATVPNVPQISIAGDWGNQQCFLENWTEQQKILPTDGVAGALLGVFVSLDGDTALVGAMYDTDNGFNSGSAYVFTRTGTTWTQQAKLLASDGGQGDFFGYPVSLDGDTALIGAVGDDNYKGSAYVFTRSGTTWTEQAKLVASDGMGGDQFGTVSLDGDTALIAAAGDNGQMGSAYIFTRTGVTWTQQQQFLASDGLAGDNFGIRVAIDGDTALIGAYLDDDPGTDSGSAYVFTYNGATWTQQAKLRASDGAAQDYFGVGAALEGDTALIGAYQEDNLMGAAYVFTRIGTNWTQQQKITVSDGNHGDILGFSVSLEGDTALISAAGDDGYQGSVYEFTRTGTTWIQQAKFQASDGTPNELFGNSVSLSGDTALVGVPWDDDNGVDSGSAFIFIKGAGNQPPVADFSWTPQNPTINQQITFDASASQDPDGTISLYEWDWDNDGVYDESYNTSTATHVWVNPGNYPVAVRVTDDDAATGMITKTVTVSDGGTVNFSVDITGGFGIKATITNTGTLNATNIQWKYTLTNGIILLGKIKSGTITSLAAGASDIAKDSPILGLGKTTIQVEVTCAEGVSVTKTATATIFLFFVLGIQEV